MTSFEFKRSLALCTLFELLLIVHGLPTNYDSADDTARIDSLNRERTIGTDNIPEDQPSTSEIRFINDEHEYYEYLYKLAGEEPGDYVAYVEEKKVIPTIVEEYSRKELGDKFCVCEKTFGDLETVQFDCKHKFHEECLREVYSNLGPAAHKTCPRCKRVAFVDGRRYHPKSLDSSDAQSSTEMTTTSQPQVVSTESVSSKTVPIAETENPNPGSNEQDDVITTTTSQPEADHSNGDSCCVCGRDTATIEFETLRFDCCHEYHAECFRRWMGMFGPAAHATCLRCGDRAYIDERKFFHSRLQPSNAPLPEEEMKEILQQRRREVRESEQRYHASRANIAVVDQRNNPLSTFAQDYVSEREYRRLLLGMQESEYNKPLELSNEAKYDQYLNRLRNKEDITGYSADVAGTTTMEESSEPQDELDDSECRICYEKYNHLDSVRFDCSHKFHKECFKYWNSLDEVKNINCPFCRRDILVDGQEYVDDI